MLGISYKSFSQWKNWYICKMAKFTNFEKILKTKVVTYLYWNKKSFLAKSRKTTIYFALKNIEGKILKNPNNKVVNNYNIILKKGEK